MSRRGEVPGGGTSLEALGMGWSLGWRVVAGGLLGYLADGYLGSGPWLALFGALGALIGGVRNMLATLSTYREPETGRSGESGSLDDNSQDNGQGR